MPPSRWNRTVLERALVALTAAVLPAFLAICAFALVAGPRFELLGRALHHGPFVLIFTWLAISAALCTLRNAVVLWRTVFALSAIILGGAAIAGVLMATPLGWPMLAALVALAISLAWVGLVIGEDKVKRPSRSRENGAPQKSKSAPEVRVAEANVEGKGDRWLRTALFTWSAILFIEAFRMAHIVGTDPHRGVGMVGMLIALLIVLPAASIAAWWPRATAVTMLIAGSLFALLLVRTVLPQVVAAALVTASMGVLCWQLLHAEIAAIATSATELCDD
jgi:hypothetical protein